ncbi:MAG: extracellular solute-binding protein [Rhodospirillaceae bacterium]
MPTLSLFRLLCIVLSLGASAAVADAIPPESRLEPRLEYGVAMHGAPKYPAGFTAFDYVNPQAPVGGTVRIGVTGTFDSLNPFIVRGRPGLGELLVYESLLIRSLDEPFSLYGLIAESVELAPDRSRVVFRLRPEARWHDGTPITGRDVLFSWQTLRTSGRPNHRTYYNRVAKAELVDERTVRFELMPAPDGTIDRELPLILGLMPILPEHWWQSRRFEETGLEPPLASGPYRISAVQPGRRLEYGKVSDYWGQGLAVRRGTANFATIRYDYYRDDGIALEAFKAGEVDVRYENDPNRWATAYDFPAARDGRVRLEVLTHRRPEPARAFIFNTRRELFRDRRVRRALGLAFDFEWINRALFHGAYKRSPSFYPNSELAATGAPKPEEMPLLATFHEELPSELFSRPPEVPHTDGGGPVGLRANLREASKLLREAGWRDVDGERVDAAGRSLSFEILLNNPADEKVALEYARTLARLGVTARVRTVDSAQFQGRLDDFDYDIVLHRWLSTLSPGNEQLIFFGSAAADQPGSRNYAGIRSPAVDALARSLGEAPDREALVTRVHALDRVLSWGFYGVPLYYLGADLVASRCEFHRPATVPVYGLPIELWWREPCR